MTRLSEKNSSEILYEYRNNLKPNLKKHLIKLINFTMLLKKFQENYEFFFLILRKNWKKIVCIFRGDTGNP